MGASNSLTFVPLFTILRWLGLITSWLLKCAVEMKLGLETGIGELNLEFSLELTSRGVESSLPVRLTFPGVTRKMRAQLRTASVTLTFGRIVRSGLKMSCTPTTLAVTSRLIGPMTTGMIFGTNRLINNFWVNFPLVVWVATSGLLLGSLFGSLTASTNVLESLIASTC